VGPARIELATYGLTCHFDFRRRPRAFVVWTVPSP
jgi:hypothetical protein